METSTTFEQVLVVWIIGWGVQKVLWEHLNNLPKVHLCMYILRLVPGDPKTLFYTFFLWCSSLSKGMVWLFVWSQKSWIVAADSLSLSSSSLSIQQSIQVTYLCIYNFKVESFFGKYVYYLHICVYMLLIKFLVAFRVFGTCYQRGYYHHNN